MSFDEIFEADLDIDLGGGLRQDRRTIGKPGTPLDETVTEH
jgi:hypothetical protein